MSCIVHVLDDAVLHFYSKIFQCNISNNCIVFCYNNCNAHFQYRPTLHVTTVLENTQLIHSHIFLFFGVRTCAFYIIKEKLICVH